ncbi:MAG: hypothetical protein ACREDR_05715 [Blastocatellia bacterium]
MAIFDQEKKFYKTDNPPASADDSDNEPALSMLIGFVADKAFVINLPISIIVYAINRSAQAIFLADLIGVTTFYLGLIGLPALVAVVLSSPALLARKRQKHRLFRRVFDLLFVALYVLLIIAALTVRPHINTP